MDWETFLDRSPKYLNLGALWNVHPHEHYNNYVGINPPGRFQNKVIDLTTGALIDHPDTNRDIAFEPKPLPYSLHHDIEKPFPIPDNSVDRVHSEDCFEHIEISKYPSILKEIYRILKPGGLFRLAVPDYMNPKDRFCIEKGYDPRNDLHITITTYELLKPILEASQFKVEFLHYWKDESQFVMNDVDYSKGYVKRTPDNDSRNTQDDPLLVTSIVCDLTK